MKKNSSRPPAAKKPGDAHLAARIKAQVVTIERVRAATGLELAQIAEMVAITPDTARKYAKGYQAASDAMIRLIEAIPDRLAARQSDAPDRKLTDRTPSIFASPKAGDVSIVQQLGEILETGEPGEIAIVRSVVDAAYKQCRKRTANGNAKPDRADDAKRIIRFPVGYQLRPIVGRIAAGMPQEAIAQTDQWLPVPPNLAPQVSFVLKVSGDSMIDREIYDGDLVLMSATREPRNGDVVAALIDHETCLKTYVTSKEGPFLKSENKSYPPKLLPVDEMIIQGVMLTKHQPE